MLYSCFTPALLLIYSCCTLIYIYMHMLYLYACTPIYALPLLYFCFTFIFTCIHVYIWVTSVCLLFNMYVYLCFLCFTPASPLLICVTDVILFCLRMFIYKSALLVLYSFFSWCVYVCVCLCVCVCRHESPHVCLLMHVGAAQARTRGRQERPVLQLVSPAAQVREMHAARAWYDALLADLVSVCIAELYARREQM